MERKDVGLQLKDGDKISETEIDPELKKIIEIVRNSSPLASGKSDEEIIKMIELISPCRAWRNEQ